MDNKDYTISKDKITIDVQDWYWCPKHIMGGKFDAIYMNHPVNNKDEWDEEKLRKRENYKKGRYKHIRYDENQLEIAEVENPHFFFTDAVCTLH